LLTKTAALAKCLQNRQFEWRCPQSLYKMFSPGIRLLSRLLAVLSLLLIAGYAVNIPPHLVFVYTILGVPLLSALRIWAARITQHRRARAAGARLVPIAPGRWLGNLDIIRDLRRNWNVSYPRTSQYISSLSCNAEHSMQSKYCANCWSSRTPTL
jgi:hypothetical protein